MDDPVIAGLVIGAVLGATVLPIAWAALRPRLEKYQEERSSRR